MMVGMCPFDVLVYFLAAKRFLLLKTPLPTSMSHAELLAEVDMCPAEGMSLEVFVRVLHNSGVGSDSADSTKVFERGLSGVGRGSGSGSIPEGVTVL